MLTVLLDREQLKAKNISSVIITGDMNFARADLNVS